MKHLLLTLSAAALVSQAAFAEYATAGNGTTYTLQSLAEIENSGIDAVEDYYLISDDITISATDRLVIKGYALLFIDSDKSLDIAGELSIIADEGEDAEPLMIAGSSFEGAPAGLRFVDEGFGTIDYADFDNCPIIQLSTKGVQITNCIFSNCLASSTNTQGVVSFVNNSTENIIRDCNFSDNEIPAIATGGNIQCQLLIEGCYFDNCNTSNTNKPFLNLTAPAEGYEIIIQDNFIQGAQLNMVGGISVANLMKLPAGKAIIRSNEIRDCRYGLNLQGPFQAEVRDNSFIDNRYESNPMNGGSGISCTAFDDGLDVIMSGNLIEGNMWGITLISYRLFYPAYYGGFKFVSLGEPENSDIDSPGGNIFRNNGNDGTAYDPSVPYALYNNSDCNLYAQNNDWGVNPEEIPNVIFDSSDNPQLGTVIYAGGTGGVTAAQLHTTAADNLIFDLQGRPVTPATRGILLTPQGKILNR